MKYFALLAGLTMAMATNVSYAADSMNKAEVDQQIEVVRSILQTEQRAVVASNLELTNKESGPFWKLYREYKNKQQKVNDQYVNIIKEFADKNATLNDQQAGKMLGEYMSYEKAYHKLRAKYSKKFSKILPEKKVFRFFQIENKIDAVVSLEMAKGIPLVQ